MNFGLIIRHIYIYVVLSFFHFLPIHFSEMNLNNSGQCQVQITIDRDPNDGNKNKNKHKTHRHTHTLKHEPNIIKIIIKNQLIHLNLYAKYTEKRQYSLAMQFLRFVISTIYLIWFPSHLFFGHFFLSPIQFFSLVLHFSISTLISGVTFSSKMTQNIFSYRL